MKNVVISANGDRKVYSVPDVVADNPENTAMSFAQNGFGKAHTRRSTEPAPVFAIMRMIL